MNRTTETSVAPAGAPVGANDPAADRRLRWWALPLCVAAVGQVVVTVVAALRNQHLLLRWDDVFMLWHDMQPQAGWHEVGRLFEQQNEHRIVFPRLLFWADTVWASASGRIVYSALLLLQFVHVFVLAAIARHCGRTSVATQAIVTSLAALMLFSSHQLENFMWRVQISSILVYLAASVAVWLLLACRRSLAQGRRRRAAAYGGLVLVAAFVANYSRADGNLLWPILALAAWWLGLPRWYVGTILVLGALSCGFYFWGYTTPPRQIPPWTVLLHYGPRVVAFVFAFLGAPATYFGLGAAITVGALGSLLGACYLGAVLTGRLQAPGAVGLLAVMAFACGSAAVTAFGRSYGPIDGALVFRYATPALLFWAALLPLVVAHLARGVPAVRRLRRFAWGGLAAFLAASLWQQPTAIARQEVITRDLDLATMALMARVCDIPALSAFNLPREFLGEVLEHMRAQRLSVFHHDQFTLLGQALRPRVAVAAAGAVTGALTAVEPLAAVAGGVKVRGWISDCPPTAAPAQIVLTDGDVVVGFASCKAALPRPDGTAEWVGYARTVERGSFVLHALAVVGTGERAIRLDGAIAVPPADGGDDSLRAGMVRALLGPPDSFHAAYMAAIGPFAAAVGLSLPASVGSASEAAAGGVTAFEAMPGVAGALRLRGFVAAAALGGAPATVLVVDALGRIIGGGSVGVGRAATATDDVSWTAWAITLDAVPVAEVYVSDGTRHLRLPPPRLPARGVVAAPGELGAVVQQEPSTNSGWASPGEITWFLPSPDGGPVADSWAGSDRNQGRYTLGPIAVDGDRTLGIPVLIGPDAGGQSARVLDAATGEVLATLDAGAFRGTWRIWRVGAAGGPRQLMVEFEDGGSGWGQWSAVGQPHWLR